MEGPDARRPCTEVLRDLAATEAMPISVGEKEAGEAKEERDAEVPFPHQGLDQLRQRGVVGDVPQMAQGHAERGGEAQSGERADTAWIRHPRPR